jgi:hypothetical protein
VIGPCPAVAAGRLGGQGRRVRDERPGRGGDLADLEAVEVYAADCEVRFEGFTARRVRRDAEGDFPDSWASDSHC